MLDKKIMLGNMMKGAFRTILILMAGILMGFMALCVIHMLPIEKMYKNVLLSKDAIGSNAQLIPGYESTTIDNYTDSIILNEAICPVKASLLEKVMYNYQVNYFRQYGQMENLLCYLEGEEGYGYQGYTHYWGGYLIVLKPLLLVFDYSDILVINGILQILLMAYVILGLYKGGKKYVILPFMVAVLSIMPMTIALCLQFSDVYYITLIGAALIVWGHGRIGNERMYILFLILGMATSYFDFLTYPFVSLGIPIAMFLVCLDKEKVKKQIFYLIQCSFLWCIGYGGMWAGKWILGSVLMPEAGSWSQALSSIIYRGGNKAEEMTLTLYDVLLRNMFIYLKWPIMILIGVLAACFVYLIISKKRFDKKALLYAIPYIIVCFYPLAWYLITRNHSYEHAFMAYRELSIATFAGLCMLARTGYGCIR